MDRRSAAMVLLLAVTMIASSQTAMAVVLAAYVYLKHRKNMQNGVEDLIICT